MMLPEAKDYQKELEDTRKGSPLELSEGARPCRHLDFRPLELWEIKFVMFEAITFLVICYSSPCSDRSRPESYNTIIKHKLGVFKKSSFSSWFLAKVSKWIHESLLLIHISDNQRVIKAAQWVTDPAQAKGLYETWGVRIPGVHQLDTYSVLPVTFGLASLLPRGLAGICCDAC